MRVDEIRDCLLSASIPVMKITALRTDQWYRNRTGSLRGPWYGCEYEVTDEIMWKRREECIYFVKDFDGMLRYVGISVNRLADRWRTSPALDENKIPLGRNELFHSQCWPAICSNYRSGILGGYEVSVLHGKRLQSILISLDHPLSCLGRMGDDTDIAVIALEVWFFNRFKNQLWNKRK